MRDPVAMVASDEGDAKVWPQLFSSNATALGKERVVSIK
jgi:hypothetical protein